MFESIFGEMSIGQLFILHPDDPVILYLRPFWRKKGGSPIFVKTKKDRIETFPITRGPCQEGGKGLLKENTRVIEVSVNR